MSWKLLMTLTEWRKKTILFNMFSLHFSTIRVIQLEIALFIQWSSNHDLIWKLFFFSSHSNWQFQSNLKSYFIFDGNFSYEIQQIMNILDNLWNWRKSDRENLIIDSQLFETLFHFLIPMFYFVIKVIPLLSFHSEYNFINDIDPLRVIY